MGKKTKNRLNQAVFRHFGGEEGIRTLVGLLPNGFQDRLVMTTSIPLRKYSVLKILPSVRRPIILTQPDAFVNIF